MQVEYRLGVSTVSLVKHRLKLKPSNSEKRQVAIAEIDQL